MAGADAVERAFEQRDAAGVEMRETFSEASSISRGCPMRPKPVTSVRAWMGDASSVVRRSSFAAEALLR